MGDVLDFFGSLVEAGVEEVSAGGGLAPAPLFSSVLVLGTLESLSPAALPFTASPITAAPVLTLSDDCTTSMGESTGSEVVNDSMAALIPLLPLLWGPPSSSLFLSPSPSPLPVTVVDVEGTDESLFESLTSGGMILSMSCLPN